MTLTLEPVRTLLNADQDGVVRIAGTRVTLDTVVEAWREGATAEEIAGQYDSLSLADVYSAIGFYLGRRAEVEEYLRQRQRQAEVVRRDNEARFSPQGVRERLMARRPEGKR